MKYKILLITKSNDINYYKYYQESASAGDWSSVDKEETLDKIKELLKDYSLSEIAVVIDLDITMTLDIPELPTEEEEENPEESEPEDSGDTEPEINE